MSRLTFREFVAPLKWIDGRPLTSVIEPYRFALIEKFHQRDALGGLLYNLGLFGRSKKNWKTCDLVVNQTYTLMAEGGQGFIVANDEGQANDDLSLLKKLIRVNPILADWLVVKKNVIERRDGDGAIEILPAMDAVGAHGKTYRLLSVDEIHGYRTWDLLEALAPDPTQLDAQWWITSYSSIFHRPGVPLFDLLKQARAGTDPRMLLSWYAADFTTDPDFADKSPEERANPSMASWGNPGYLAQQQRRLPAHKYRRLHLNLPGLPEGSAYQPEPVMDAVERGVRERSPVPGTVYTAFVDMSGGSSDDAVLSIVHAEGEGRVVLDLVQDQGQRPPFDPNAAVTRFVRTLKSYGVACVAGDRYAGETFRAQFEKQGIAYEATSASASDLLEGLEPLLNGRRVSLLDVPTLEQQLLGSVWRGGKIDHRAGEHNDYAVAVAGAVVMAQAPAREPRIRQLYNDDEWAEMQQERFTRAVAGGDAWDQW